jgi:riboflavin biosynthesis pyrimidine reductase
MRALLPELLEPVDVHDWYARDWVDRTALRVNFVASVDGAATAEGASSGLQTAGDNMVFAALRDLADVVLAGAGTVRTEGYAAISVSARRREIRRRFGLRDVLPTAVISRSLRLDPAAALFTDAAPAARTIVITCASADPTQVARFADVADVVIAGDDDVDPVLAKAALADRGLTRILCEGGPTLFADLARARVVDELCLSITPLLAGPGARRIVAGPIWADGPLPLVLHSLLEEDGALFCRYVAG